MPSHVVRSESRKFPYNVKYIPLYYSLKYLRDFNIVLLTIPFCTVTTMLQLAALPSQISRFISVTFKINAGT